MPGLTFQQLQQMGAQPSQPKQGGGLTFEQLQGMGAKPAKEKSFEQKLDDFTLKAAEFVGVKNLGEALAIGGMGVVGQLTGNKRLEQLATKAAQKGPTARQVAGDIGQVALTLGGGAIGKLGQAAGRGAQALAKGSKLAGALGRGAVASGEAAAFGAAGAAQREEDLAEGAKEGLLFYVGLKGAGKALGAVSKGAGIIGQTIDKISQAKLADKAGKLAEEIISYPTGLKPDTIRQVVKNPNMFTAKEMQSFDRKKIFDLSKDSIEKAITELGETGAAYQPIRQSGAITNIPTDKIINELDKFGLKFENGIVNKKGKLLTNLTDTDLNEVRKAINLITDETGNISKNLDSNSYLNFRQQMDELAKYESGASTKGRNAISRIRGVVDEVAKKEIPGLKKVDESFKSQIGDLQGIREKMFDKKGNIKDNAMSYFSNLTGKGKEKALEKMKKFVPDIEEKINLLKAIEDIEISRGNKVGAYAKNILFSGGAGFAISGGNPIAGVATALITNPSIAVPMLRAFGKLKGKGTLLIENIGKKLSKGSTLNTAEKSLFKEAIQAKAAGELSESSKGLLNKSSGNQYAYGAFAGIQPERDENGKIIGVKFDPKMAGLGMMAGGVMKKVGDKKLLQEARKYKSADSFLARRYPGINLDSKNQLPGKIEAGGINVSIGEEPGAFYLGNIEVAEKGKGLGTKIINDLKAYADANKKTFHIPRPINSEYWGKFKWFSKDPEGGIMYTPKSQLTDIYNQANK